MGRWDSFLRTAKRENCGSTNGSSTNSSIAHIRRKLSAKIVKDTFLRGRAKASLLATAVALVAFIFMSCASSGPVTEQRTTPLIDDPIGRAFASGASDVQVEGEGTVTRVLTDDLNGSGHQRFIVELASGQTLLITHNIDIAPRIDGLKIGDSVRFNGEYVWNEKGGVIHWTHHDPQGRHVSGWVIHDGKTYK